MKADLSGAKCVYGVCDFGSEMIMARTLEQIVARGQGTGLVRICIGCDPETGKRKCYNQTIHGSCDR